MDVVRHGRVDPTPLLTHTFSLNEIKDACELFGKRAEGVIKAALKP
jgi:threonine dehydrogenase-like Zn-dependent dehydrogenase